MSAAVAVGLLLPAGTFAATTIGKTQSDPFANCSVGDNLVQGVSSLPPYAVPAGGGVITSWAHAGRSAANAGQGKLLVWRPTGDPSQFRLVGRSTSQTFTPSTKVSYLTRIPVQAGDVLGMRIENANVACWISQQADGMRLYNGAEPADNSIQTFGNEQFTQNVNVEATVEPDADGDGFGDESQDQCVGTAGTESGCPPPAETPPETPPEEPPAEDQPPAEGTAPATPTKGDIGAKGPIVEQRKIEIRKNPPQIRLVPDCPKDRVRAELSLTRLADDGTREGNGRPTAFRCRDGRASFIDDSGFTRLPRSWWKAAHTAEGLVLLATIEQEGEEPVTEPVWLHDADADAPDQRRLISGLSLSCHNFDVGTMGLAIPTTYGYQDQALQWHKVQALGQRWTRGVSSAWQPSSVFTYRLNSNGAILGNLGVVGGSLGVGGASYLTWNGANLFTVNHGSWAHIYLYTWTARYGWRGDYVAPEDLVGATRLGEWCGF